MKSIRPALRRVCDAIQSKKGEDLTILDVTGISAFADFFVICHGHNPNQIQAICDEVLEKLKVEEHLTPHHVEGYALAEWILIDYISFVIHVFSQENRQFYRLENLWGDGVPVAPEALSA